MTALEEWPGVYRSILLQGERLSVDDMCPVIVHSLNGEECQLQVSGQPGMVTLDAFLATVISGLVLILGLVVVLIILLSFILWSRRRRVYYVCKIMEMCYSTCYIHAWNYKVYKLATLPSLEVTF